MGNESFVDNLDDGDSRSERYPKRRRKKDLKNFEIEKIDEYHGGERNISSMATASIKTEEMERLVGKAIFPFAEGMTSYCPIGTGEAKKNGKITAITLTYMKNEDSSSSQKRISNMSSKEVIMDVNRVMNKYLSKYLPGATTKDSAMRIMAGDSLYADAPKFSKYSGVTEWKNVIVLWVNIDGEEYKNQGIEGGSKLTWFGGSRHYHDSSVVQRMLNVSRAKEKIKYQEEKEPNSNVKPQEENETNSNVKPQEEEEPKQEEEQEKVQEKEQEEK